ncbi:Ig-like domain-containing protein [Klebsiella oxytoca]
MDQKFFRVPWASSGDRASISETQNSDGTVSYQEGWGEDYQKDMLTDANAKPVERDVMNAALNDITVAIRQYQTNGYPEWITTADNNGVAFGYDAGVVVSYNGALYLSLMAGNTATPGADAAKWQPYIQREATEAEALDGTGSTQVMTPRRTKALAESLDKELFTSIKPYTVPIGGGMLWFTPIVPEGWIEAGQPFDKAKNPILATIYPSGRAPTVNGYFLRFWDNGAGVDPDGARELLSIQDDAIIDHAHYAGIETYYRHDIPDTPTRNSPGGESIRQYRARTGAISPEPAVKVATETRAKNVAVMLIIKTDQAETSGGETQPTAIIITPNTAVIEAGKTQQFKATVLPASIGGGFPVSWTVSDSSLGSINSSGLYTSKAGVSGKQTVIASISTGLTATTTVEQNIWLTSITIGSIPSELLAGNTYSIPITYSPTGYTENVLSSSSDGSIASLTSAGVLDIYSAGSATLTLTGASSGVTRSVTITATEVEAPEVYLAISKNFSEIKEAGTTAQTAARGNLGLGSLATKSSLGAGDVGAVPLASASLPAGTDLDSVTAAGEYFQSVTSNATTALHYPEAVAGALKVVATGVSAGACRQFYWPYNSSKEYRRAGFGTPIAFTAWTEH